MADVVSSTTPTSVLIDKNGKATYPMIKWMQGIGLAVNASFNPDGTFSGNLSASVTIDGRHTLASIVQYIDAGGVVTGPGIDFARAYQNKDTDHINDGTGSPLAGGKEAFRALIASGPVDGSTIRYNGTEWEVVPIAISESAGASQFLKSYDATTGTFTAGTLPPPGVPNLGNVNNQSGNTAYSTQVSDNGSFLVFRDASAIAVLLNSGAIPFFFFTTNLGVGAATFTPASGTINGAANVKLLTNESAIIAFDGVNWWAASIPVQPLSLANVVHKWLNSYDATTGLFTQTQPDYADLTGTPTLPSTKAVVTGEYLTGYDSTTGLFTQSATPGISVTIITAALTLAGTQGSMTFVGGILTAQVAAT